MVFLGGAVLAEIMKDREQFWMSRAEYQEQGVGVMKKLGISVHKWASVGSNSWTLHLVGLSETVTLLADVTFLTDKFELVQFRLVRTLSIQLT